MRIKGIDEFLEKLPDYRGKRILVVPLTAILSFLVSLGLMMFADLTPRLFPQVRVLQIIESLMPILSTLFFEALGLFLISRIWTKKSAYLEKYGEKAYQKSIYYITVGIPLFISSMLHAFIPIHLIPPFPSEGSITWIMANNLSTFLFYVGDPIYVPRIMIAFLFVLLGIGTLLRALDVFGLDYMSMVYLYYPEESEVQDNEIYSILRHPAYHGIILISFGAIFLRFSVYSLLICLFFIIGLNIHVKFVEEKELKQRFGKAYKKYMETTNALFYSPKNIGKYFKFLLGK
jgi:protein-S-isoprenylcysteine O-methyltransferase Ste14